MRRILDWIFGYVMLSLPLAGVGPFPEALRKSGITQRDMRLTDTDAVFLFPLFARRRILTICDGLSLTGKMEIRGLPAILYRYRSRIGIPLGVLLMALMIRMSSGRIWAFRISGNSTVSDEEIIAGLTSLGCGIGDRPNLRFMDEVENEFALASDGICWISVNMKGTTAEVQVREVVRRPEESETLCANVVARESGQIVYVDASGGRAAAVAGQTVKKGDLLISGVVESKDGKTRYETAAGVVKARVTRTFEVSVSPEREEKVYTGRETVTRVLSFFGKNINLFGNGGKSEANCDMIERKEMLSPFRDEALPVFLTTTTAREYRMETVRLTEAEAVAEGLSRLKAQTEELLGDGELLSKTVSSGFENGVYTIRCELYLETDIAESVTVPIESGTETE